MVKSFLGIETHDHAWQETEVPVLSVCVEPQVLTF